MLRPVPAAPFLLSHRLLSGIRFPAATPALWMVCAVAVCLCGSAGAQTIREDFYATNGPVDAAVLSGNTLYIGGGFTYVGPATGGGVPIDAASGASAGGFPKVRGEVHAVAPDGSGGWYIGGNFTAVGGIPRSNLAHILADNTVSAWNPNADGGVFALAMSGSTVYAGGNFNSIGGSARNNIAALDATTGVATGW
ncbi:MAG: hypothetical protein ABIS67_02085, partial [Candidatus Eisenbacteria bacterium]